MSSNSNPDGNIEQIETMDVQTAQRVEQEKMTRRAALRKLGFGAGLAAFSLLGVDDLARLVGKRMERMAGDNKVANQIAKEFQGAGVAFAGGPSWLCHSCDDKCAQHLGPYQYCAPCVLPCTGSIVKDENCGDFSQVKCRACCSSRNPGPIISPNPGYSLCVATAGCI